MFSLVTLSTALHVPSTQRLTAATPTEAGLYGRRAALLTTGATVWAAAQPALAAEGDWAVHKGEFDDGFFKGFQTNNEGFTYKFVQEGEGPKPEPFQKVFVHCEPQP